VYLFTINGFCLLLSSLSSAPSNKLSFVDLVVSNCEWLRSPSFHVAAFQNVESRWCILEGLQQCYHTPVRCHNLALTTLPITLVVRVQQSVRCVRYADNDLYDHSPFVRVPTHLCCNSNIYVHIFDVIHLRVLVTFPAIGHRYLSSVPNYITWRQRYTCVDNLPKVIIHLRCYPSACFWLPT